MPERDYPPALAELDRIAPQAKRLGREASLVTIDLLRARIDESRVRSDRATEHLRAALLRGAQLGLVCTVVDGGQQVLHLLHRLLSTGRPDAELASYIQQLIEHFPGSADADSPRPAAGTSVRTPREAEIVRLVAASTSNQQIARDRHHARNRQMEPQECLPEARRPRPIPSGGIGPLQ
ncbi:MAG: hypothetical protein LCH74_14165 [Proteobacteria bacterium]|nr:hypothetical protein [Pseudomonadota bacterium]